MFIAMKWYLYLLTSYDQVVIVKIVRQVTFKNWIIQCINHGLKVYIYVFRCLSQHIQESTTLVQNLHHIHTDSYSDQ